MREEAELGSFLYGGGVLVMVGGERGVDAWEGCPK